LNPKKLTEKKEVIPIKSGTIAVSLANNWETWQLGNLATWQLSCDSPKAKLQFISNKLINAACYLATRCDAATTA